MANAPADIAELQRALEVCCAELAEALAGEDGGGSGAGGDPPGAPGLPGVPALDAAGGPRWRPLELAPLPGLDLLVKTIQPPLQVIVALLKVIAALLEALAAILIGILDPLRAIIAAAVALLRDIIDDLLNAGAYLYLDAPGVFPTEVSLKETGLVLEPEQDWIAGRKLKPPPAAPDAFQRWASRFQGSFDDPGDPGRPVVTEGAPVQAVFLVMAAPSPHALRQLLYVLGKLFNVDQFKSAVDKYAQTSDDPRKQRLQKMKGVAPDWQSLRLVDLIPPLKELGKLPDLLLGLLSAVDGIVGLIKGLAAAMQDKAKTLLQLAEAIQAIIDLLDALKSSGIYALPVATTAGARGLADAFLRAADRPPGGYVGGLCLLASGPNLAKASMLWQMLGVGTAMDLLEGDLTPQQVWEDIKNSSTAKLVEQGYGKVEAELEASIATAKAEGKKLASHMEGTADAFRAAVRGQPDELFAAMGVSREAFDEILANGRAVGVEMLAQTGRVFDDEVIRRGIADTRLAGRSGTRSLALGFGPPRAAPGGGKP